METANGSSGLGPCIIVPAGTAFGAVTATDPKGQEGAKKCPLGLIPPEPARQAAWAHKHGADKYGPWNWRKTGVTTMTYINAIRRHMDAYLDGEDLDPESKLSHLAHVIASANILIDAGYFDTLSDDRPPKRP